MQIHPRNVFAVLTASVLMIVPTDVRAVDPAEDALEFQSTPHTLSAADILAGIVLTGPDFGVKDPVRNDGMVNTYEIRSAHGDFSVETTEMLKIRLNELDALYRMQQLKGTSVYGDAVKKAGKSPFSAAKSLVTSPIDTSKKLVSGVGRWFADVGRAATSSDPHQAGVIKTAAGHAPALRQFAVEFGVDPYSSFEPLANELNDVAWTATGGGLTVRVAFMAIPGPGGTAVRATSMAGGMKNLVRDNSPAQLHKIMTEKLLAMGAGETLISEFLANEHYTPQEKLHLTLYLEEMDGVDGRALFLDAAKRAPAETIAVFMRVRAGMLLAQARQHGGGRMMLASGVPFLVTADGKAIGAFPLDYLLWTKTVADREAEISKSLSNNPAVKEKHFVMTGPVHPRAREALEAAGWMVADRSPS